MSGSTSVSGTTASAGISATDQLNAQQEEAELLLVEAALTILIAALKKKAQSGNQTQDQTLTSVIAMLSAILGALNGSGDGSGATATSGSASSSLNQALESLAPLLQGLSSGTITPDEALQKLSSILSQLLPSGATAPPAAPIQPAGDTSLGKT